jgi:hypothetical protein
MKIKIKIKIQKKIGKKESTYMIGGVPWTHLADPHDYFQKPDSYFQINLRVRQQNGCC